MEFEFSKYVRVGRLPHIWCPGCGLGVAMHSFLTAAEKLDLDQNKTVLVSGIGCSGRITGYLDFNTLHTTHGRALAFATGIKLGNPDLKVIVFMGDGDATAIGGNHFIHAARRNIDLTAIVLNNSIYGMTGGQYSPTTPMKARASTAPYGMMERPFDISELAIAAGASYVARSTVYHANQLADLMGRAIRKKGFSVLEAITYCHTTFGRRNKMPSPMENMQWLKKHTVSIKQVSEHGPDDRITVGELVNRDYPEYTAEYQHLIDLFQPLPRFGDSMRHELPT